TGRRLCRSPLPRWDSGPPSILTTSDLAVEGSYRPMSALFPTVRWPRRGARDRTAARRPAVLPGCLRQPPGGHRGQAGPAAPAAGVSCARRPRPPHRSLRMRTRIPVKPAGFTLLVGQPFQADRAKSQAGKPDLRPGFTLIELLVVMAIIAILIGL